MVASMHSFIYDPSTITNEETYLQDVVEIQKHLLPTFLKKYVLYATTPTLLPPPLESTLIYIDMHDLSIQSYINHVNRFLIDL